MTSTITITYGDQAENHKGMQIIGNSSISGYSTDDLQSIKLKYESLDCKCELIDLGRDASILIVRKGINCILKTINRTADDLFAEQLSLDYDKSAYMYGKVINKHARYNLCFSDFSQEPDYANKKGRIINFTEVPLTKYVREELSQLGSLPELLQGEGNYYYDITKCGIGFHGDSERKKVIGVRLGATIPLHYQWFHKNAPIEDRIKLLIDHGDFYIMNNKATGNDWKRSSIYTLRHAAGAKKFLSIPTK